jgi:hypothetical protein
VKRIALLLIFLLTIAVTAIASEYEIEKVAGNYKVEMRMENTPAVIGANEVEVGIKGMQGHHVKDADVELYYFMPSMPAMNYTAKASLEGNGYRAVVKPTMPGKWSADVKFKRPDEELQKASFDFVAK